MNGKGCGVGAVRPFPSPRRKRSGQGDCVVCGRAPLLRPPVPAFLLLRRGPRLAARSASTRGWPPARIAIAIPHLHNGGSSILGPRRQQEEEEVGGGEHSGRTGPECKGGGETDVSRGWNSSNLDAEHGIALAGEEGDPSAHRGHVRHRVHRDGRGRPLPRPPTRRATVNCYLLDTESNAMPQICASSPLVSPP